VEKIDSATRPVDIDPDALSTAQREVHDVILAGPRGVVEGPLRVWLLSPELASKAQALGAFCRYDTSLPPDLSELAILVTGAYWRAGFEWHVHGPLAVSAGVPAGAVDAIREEREPDLSGAQSVVYRFARALLRDHEVDDETYGAVVASLGLAGTVELVGVLGYYGLISMTIKAFRVPVPQGSSEPFANVGQGSQ
jgi:4-carboxymuconolactone decarboxylase